MNKLVVQKIDKKIKRVEDFPIKGVLFYDITPVLQDGELFAKIIANMKAFAKKVGAQAIAVPESRGFIFGGALAYATKLPLILVRKPKKLPRQTFHEKYSLEYNDNASLEMHIDAIKPKQKILIVDDLLATAGTVQAISRLIKKAKGQLVGYSFLIELLGLGGTELLDKNLPVNVILKY
ncbi:adenine phosphoribosyltransferase [[Mycoplasma] testudinis]|uniref:adenine phosphoribosyltransferase n=1 Tax=[Mycoplasma] testudinis TaxID=33924 RepID=UPI0004805774|nr:adenine phosphoribosyltransferase [[Mycoplasma] testudinis]